MKRKIFRMKHRRGKPTGSASIRYAKDAARDVTNSEHIKVRKRQIPSSILRHVESNVGVRFKKRPKLFTYEPTKGHYFKPKKTVGGWDGASLTGYDIKTGKIIETIIVLPASHLKNKKLKDNVITHELAETLVGQHMIEPHKRRRRDAVSNFEHGFGLAYEKKHCDKHKMSRQQISALAKKLFNENMTKKNGKK